MTRAQADALVEELEKARKAKDMSAEARSKLKRDIDKRGSRRSRFG